GPGLQLPHRPPAGARLDHGPRSARRQLTNHRSTLEAARAIGLAPPLRYLGPASVRVQPDRERAVVDELDQHLRAELAGLDVLDAGVAERGGEAEVELL